MLEHLVMRYIHPVIINGNFITSNANGPNYDPLQIMQKKHIKGIFPSVD